MDALCLRNNVQSSNLSVQHVGCKTCISLQWTNKRVLRRPTVSAKTNSYRPYGCIRPDVHLALQQPVP
eukprot:1157948-Pelagomonas_calceolata.AAC.2